MSFHLDRVVTEWEGRELLSHDNDRLEESVARSVLRWMWNDLEMEKYSKAPAVRVVDKDSKFYAEDCLAYWDYASGTVFCMGQPSTITLVHELAHAITEDPLAQHELQQPVEKMIHGPVWLGNFLFLLDRYMGPKCNTFQLRSSLPAEIKGWNLSFFPVIYGKSRVDLLRKSVGGK